MILALVDLLERSNRRVELTMLNAVTGSLQGSHIRIAVQAKRADAPANPAVLAFAIANVATQRRLCWAVRETLPETARKTCSVGPSGGYGHTDARWADGHDVPGTTFISGIGKEDTASDASRKAWLAKQLAQQGIQWDGE